jgi:Ran GTPase-activating protein (RanGAP) involved in mRNA processing and transport
MGKKSDKKKIRTIEIQIHKGDFKNLRDIAEMIGYDSVEEYIEDAIVRVATADYNMITMLAEDHLTRMHDKVCSLFSDEKDDEAEEVEIDVTEDEKDEEEADEKEAESEDKEVVEAEASEEAAPVKEVPHKTTRRAKKEEKVEEAAAEAPAEKTEA